METPTLEELDVRVGYRLRRDIPVREKPFTCSCCKAKHRIVGAENHLPKPGTTVLRTVTFCAECVANGRAYNEVIYPSVQAVAPSPGEGTQPAGSDKTN